MEKIERFIGTLTSDETQELLIAALYEAPMPIEAIRDYLMDTGDFGELQAAMQDAKKGTTRE